LLDMAFNLLVNWRCFGRRKIGDGRILVGRLFL